MYRAAELTVLASPTQSSTAKQTLEAVNMPGGSAHSQSFMARAPEWSCSPPRRVAAPRLQRDAPLLDSDHLLRDSNTRRYNAGRAILLRDCSRRMWKARAAEKTTSGTATAATRAILRRRAMRTVAGCSSDMTHSPAVRIMLSGSTPSACKHCRQYYNNYAAMPRAVGGKYGNIQL